MKAHLNKDWLEQEYNKGRSLQSIADELLIARESVRLKFKLFGIKRRETASHFKDNPKPKEQRDKMSISKKKFWDSMDEEYHNKHKLKVSQARVIHHTRFDGRKFVYVLNRGQVLRYRLLMESIIGRELKQNEVIHHKDGICTNDDLSNLEILTPAEHGRIHYSQKKLNSKGQFIKA